MNRYYGNRVTGIMTRRQQLLAELEKANAEIEAHKQDAEARKELFFRRNQASAALNAYDKRAGEELKALVNGLQNGAAARTEPDWPICRPCTRLFAGSDERLRTRTW